MRSPAARPVGIVLDFYGTVVVDDDEAVSSITAAVASASGGQVPADEVGRVWWSHFEAGCTAPTGRAFVLQRDLATRYLARTLDELGLDLDASRLTERMWHCWQAPQAYADARVFLNECPLPVCVLSDIDRADVEAAIAHNGLPIEQLVSSEDVRAYKPAPDGFRAASALLGLPLTDLWCCPRSEATSSHRGERGGTLATPCPATSPARPLSVWGQCGSTATARCVTPPRPFPTSRSAA